MYIELFIHVAHLADLRAGRAVNCKINYAGQYDVKITLDLTKYLVVSSNSTNQNLVTVKKKTLMDRLKGRK